MRCIKRQEKYDDKKGVFRIPFGKLYREVGFGGNAGFMMKPLPFYGRGSSVRIS
jgi:hypothetical protein